MKVEGRTVQRKYRFRTAIFQITVIDKKKQHLEETSEDRVIKEWTDGGETTKRREKRTKGVTGEGKRSA